MVKKLPANAGDARDADLIPGSGRSLGVGNDNPLWYSFLENPMDRGAWWVTVHGVKKGQTQLNQHAQYESSFYMMIVMMIIIQIYGL